MSVFADTSALVKRYVHEPGSSPIAELHAPLVLSELSTVEVPSALWQKHRAGELDPENAAVLVDEFLADANDDQLGWALVHLTPRLLGEAIRLLARHPLRSGDAIQLACAVAADSSTLLAFDRRLREAGAREGLRLLP